MQQFSAERTSVTCRLWRLKKGFFIIIWRANMTSVSSVTSWYANVIWAFLWDLAGEEVIVFIDLWPLISLNILLASNQISRILTHKNPMDFAKGSPNVSKRELLAGEDGMSVALSRIIGHHTHSSIRTTRPFPPTYRSTTRPSPSLRSRRI
jgi:hypothetical protein